MDLKEKSCEPMQTTPQEGVTNDQGYIELAPATRRSSTCRPTIRGYVYGSSPSRPIPVFAIGALGSSSGGAPIQYGLASLLLAFHYFGWLAWGLDCGRMLFDHSDYYTHSATVRDRCWPHGGPRAYDGRGEQGRMHLRRVPIVQTRPKNYNQR